MGRGGTNQRVVCNWDETVSKFDDEKVEDACGVWRDGAAGVFMHTSDATSSDSRAPGGLSALE